jgi:regulator of telomere elongation helicase 1
MFDASSAFKKLEAKGLRSILITSGTLSPMDQLEHELGVPFPHKLQNGHVIDPGNLLLEVITTT